MSNPSKRNPMDFMAIYLTPEVGVGSRMSVETIDRRLAGLPLVPVLNLLSQINYRADALDSVTERIAFPPRSISPGASP